MRCSNCGEKIERCECCNMRFIEGNGIICLYGIRDNDVAKYHFHFCCEECALDSMFCYKYAEVEEDEE